MGSPARRAIIYDLATKLIVAFVGNDDGSDLDHFKGRGQGLLEVAPGNFKNIDQLIVACGLRRR